MGNNQYNLDYIYRMYDKYKDTNEANICHHVVTNFLGMLGYDKDDFEYEKSHFNRGDGRVDIAVKITTKEFLYVEVKAANKKLREDEKSQLATYLFNSGLEWGLLTNGSNFILLNSKIDITNDYKRDSKLDMVVLDLNIFKEKDLEYLKLLNKENLFEKNFTRYFKDIAQYKAKQFPEGGDTWIRYKGTIINFFKYLIKKNKNYSLLETIRLDEFEEFLLSEPVKLNGRAVNSKSTISTKYSHIRSFFNVLNVRAVEFDKEREILVERLNMTDTETKQTDVLKEYNINKILNHYNSIKEATRNKVILLLCLSFGFERSTIINLKWSMIDEKYIQIDNRKLEIPNLLKKELDELKNEFVEKNIKCDYIICTKHNKRYKKVSDALINTIFDQLKSIEDSFKLLNSAYIRNYLIKELFYNNYSIEEIMYLTGSDVSSIGKIIKYDEVIKHLNNRKNKSKKHPFKEILSV